MEAVLHGRWTGSVPLALLAKVATALTPVPTNAQAVKNVAWVKTFNIARSKGTALRGRPPTGVGPCRLARWTAAGTTALALLGMRWRWTGQPAPKTPTLALAT